MVQEGGDICIAVTDSCLYLAENKKICKAIIFQLKNKYILKGKNTTSIQDGEKKKNIPQFVVIHTVKGFSLVDKAEVVFFFFFLNSLDFSIIQHMLAK